MTQFRGRRLAAIYFGYLVLHAAFDAAARIFQVSDGVSLWYPPVGLALALTTLVGFRCAPVVLAAHLYSSLVTGFIPSNWTLYTLPVVITAVYVTTGVLIRRRFGAIPAPEKPMQTAWLVLLHLAAPLCASILGTAIVLAGDATSGAPLTIAFSWWLGDLTGVMTIVPLCFVHVFPRLLGQRVQTQRPWSGAYVIEIIAQGAALLVCLALVDGFGPIKLDQAYYLTFVPLVWICLRHGFAGATIAVLLLTMGSLVTMQASGPSTAAITDLLMFEIATMCIGLGLGATVTRRWRAENERSRLLAILEATPDLIGTTDLEGRMIYRNAAFLRLRGFKSPQDGRGRLLKENLPAWAGEKLEREGFPAAIAQGHWQSESAFLDLQGREVPVSHLLIAHYDRDGLPALLSTIARDISADKKAEKARLASERNLLQTQKLESLGVLAGGIAHDFNNLLTVMLGHAALAQLDVLPENPAHESLRQIELAALRAAELCRQMLAYSGKGGLATQPVDLSSLVEATADLLKVSVSKKCTLKFELTAALPPINGDATQLNQIAMNLVMNASDACGEQGGLITVRTGLMQAEAAYLAATYLAPDLEPGPYVYLEVSDDGPGMPDAVLARIFEPFFTTKFSGHGLGLSAVLGIVRSHHGAVNVETLSGQGSTFRLLFPEAAGALGAPVSEDLDLETWRGAGRVLVVDDEAAVRETAALILERYGFTTTPAVNGQEGVDFVQQDPGAFCAVLLDLTMPVMDGEEAFREFQRLNPTLPVVLMSGYNRTDSSSRFDRNGLAGFVQKPFDAMNLIRGLRDALYKKG